MAKRFKTQRRINFADCDPAQIVFTPRFFEMFDRNSENMFRDRGMHWEDVHARTDFAGVPVLDIKASFKVRVEMGDIVEIHSWIEEFRGKTFLLRHEIYKGDVLCCECRELRVYIVTDESRPSGVRAVPMPEDLRELLEG